MCLHACSCMYVGVCEHTWFCVSILGNVFFMTIKRLKYYFKYNIRGFVFSHLKIHPIKCHRKPLAVFKWSLQFNDPGTCSPLQELCEKPMLMTLMLFFFLISGQRRSSKEASHQKELMSFVLQLTLRHVFIHTLLHSIPNCISWVPSFLFHLYGE